LRLGLAPEAVSPRPRDVDVAAAARHAEQLRRVPRRLALQLPAPVLLAAEGVTVTYGGVRALADLTLEVRRGEIVGLIGANGAGKSTFFNAVSGFAPTQGSIRYKGVELLGPTPPSRRTSLGVARTFQDMGLVRSETVRDNVLLVQTWLARYPAPAGLVALGSSLPDEAMLRHRAALALELFGLDQVAGERLGDLPYGTMRIAEIAAAVAAGPELLLLDEATAGLGPQESHALGDRFLALRGELGLTLVVIEHHVPLIARVCDYCYCLESGTLIAHGTPDEVVAQPDVVRSFLGRTSAGEVA
jgi:branched-chain amino acid transport system ATP-binding protein